VAGVGLLFAAGVFADSAATTFEDFSSGTVDGQQGWKASSPTYDQEVVSGSLPDAFGTKALRISDAVTSGTFDDWVFAEPVVNGAGEADAAAGTFAAGERQTHFEASFSILSADPDHTQGGLHLMVSPDRGDGARMSYLVFEDTFNGIDVTFSDVQGENADADFAYTQIASNLDRSVPHVVKFVMDFVDGQSNDVVKIYIDDQLVHTGTSWENYYRYIEAAPSVVASPITRTLIFQSRTGDYLPANQPEHQGKGFLIDNVDLSSSLPPVTTPPASVPAEATIEVKKVVAGYFDEDCFNVLVDDSSICLGAHESAEVGVAAGQHTVGEDAPGYNHIIYCVSDARVVAYGPYGSGPATMSVNEGEHVVCTITTFMVYGVR
jgi:hypothetical protein